MNKSFNKTLQIGDSKSTSKNRIIQSPEERLCANVLSYANKLNNTELQNNGSCSSKRGNS